jgi:alpha-L-fucosidase
MQGMTKSGEFAGDFGTPEQEVPPQGFSDGRLWESCMTINDTWGYARNDTNWKSTQTLIRHLCDIAHKGGNFLLNVGPTAEGEFPAPIVRRLTEIGEWMKVNRESIHATMRSPLQTLPFEGRCTVRGSTLYLHVFHWPPEGLMLTGLKSPVRSAVALNGRERLQVVIPAGSEGTVFISQPKRLDPNATVIALQLEGAP